MLGFRGRASVATRENLAITQKTLRKAKGGHFDAVGQADDTFLDGLLVEGELANDSVLIRNEAPREGAAM